MEGQNYSVKERLEQLEALMGKYTAGGKDLCVAFSGGVDSSLILKAAVKAATKDGSKVYAVTFDSRLHPSCDLEIANRVAAELGGVHKVIHVNELEQEAIRMNPVNRCYLCKKHLFVNLKEMAKLRLERPEATLKELGEALEPPVGKSGVNHRLRKLSLIAQDIRERS